VFKEIYSSLPVEFFQNGNMAELSHVLLTFEEQAIDTCRIRAQIDKTYNFKNITQIILDTINNDYKK
jgi:hypothetical protein